MSAASSTSGAPSLAVPCPKFLEPRSPEDILDLYDIHHERGGALCPTSVGSLAWYKENNVSIEVGDVQYAANDPSAIHTMPIPHMVIRNEDGSKEVVRYTSPKRVVCSIPCQFPCKIMIDGLRDKETGHYRPNAPKVAKTKEENNDNTSYNANSLKDGTISVVLETWEESDWHSYTHEDGISEEEKKERMAKVASLVKESNDIFNLMADAAKRFEILGCTHPSFLNSESAFYKSVYATTDKINKKANPQYTLTESDCMDAIEEERAAAKTSRRGSLSIIRIGEVTLLDSDGKPRCGDDGKPLPPRKQISARHHLGQEEKGGKKAKTPAQIEKHNASFSNPNYDPHGVDIVGSLPPNVMYKPLTVVGGNKDQKVFPIHYQFVGPYSALIASLEFAPKIFARKSSQKPGADDLIINPQFVARLEFGCYIKALYVISTASSATGGTQVAEIDAEEVLRKRREEKKKQEEAAKLAEMEEDGAAPGQPATLDVEERLKSKKRKNDDPHDNDKKSKA